MGKREFYSWVAQVEREIREQHETTPDSWKNTEKDEWWEQARARRERSRGR